MTLHCFVVDHHKRSPVQIHGTGARCGLRRWPDRRVRITAGASAPPHLVNQLVDALSGLGRISVREAAVVHEDVQFSLPRELG
jgi:hypothetical protein